MRRMASCIVSGIFHSLNSCLTARTSHCISVGLSTSSFRASQLVTQVGRGARRCTIHPRRVGFRIARRTFLSISGVAPVVLTFHRTNCRITVSSFNVNCSGLRGLGSLGISVLGVSGSFIRALAARGADRLVTRRVVRLTRDLKLGAVTRNIRARRRIG